MSDEAMSMAREIVDLLDEWGCPPELAELTRMAVVQALDATHNAAVEACAMAALNDVYSGVGRLRASESADRYYAQDDALRAAAAVIRTLRRGTDEPR